MQALWKFVVDNAWLVALACAVGAAYALATAYRARRDVRVALFTIERQSANNRAIRSGLIGLMLIGLMCLFFGLSLMREGTAQSTEQPPRPQIRTSTPSSGIAPTLGITPTRLPGTVLPTVPPPPPATKTPGPVVVTPAPGGRSAVVAGAADTGGLAFRKAPNGELIDRLPDGTVVELLGETQTVAGREWQRVRDSKGREGWVAGEYLIINP